MSNNIQGLSDIYSILQLYGINSSSSTNSLSSTSLSSLTNSTSKSSLNDLSSLSSLGSVLGTSSNSSSSSSAFNIMLTRLLSAISEKNKYAKTEAEKVSLEGILSTYNSSVLSSGSTSINNYITADVSNLTVDERIENAVELYSNQHGVDSNLVKAIIKVESNFDPNVVSSAGAKGLMQLMPENCKALGVEDPFNIEQNIEGGVKHIKEYIDRYDGDIEMH